MKAAVKTYHRQRLFGYLCKLHGYADRPDKAPRRGDRVRSKLNPSVLADVIAIRGASSKTVSIVVNNPKAAGLELRNNVLTLEKFRELFEVAA